MYGNYYYLFRSAYFWFSILLVVILALLPRYLYKAYMFAFHPSDMDMARWIVKQDPTHDFSQDKQGGLARLQRSPTRKEIKRHSLQQRPGAYSASRTDMSTGLRSVNRGFDFATEENGVAMQRIQSHLSERHQAAPVPKRRRNPSALMQSFFLRRTLRRKKHSSHPNDEPSYGSIGSPPDSPPPSHR